MGWSQRQLQEKFDTTRKRAKVHLRMVQDLCGGMPCDRDGVEKFVKYQLEIEPGDARFAEAVNRILKEEVKDVTPPEGEIESIEVYNVKVLRQSAYGAYVMEHQIKAMMKQATSFCEPNKAKSGAKGEMSEGARVRAIGPSLIPSERWWEIYLRLDGNPAPLSYRVISGCVGWAPKRQIHQHVQVAPPGTELFFEVLWQNRVVDKEYVAKLFWAASDLGLGSVRGQDAGKFEVVNLEFEE